MIELQKYQTIGSIVAEDYRTASVFKKYEIDFCCKGGRELSDVCRQKNVSEEEIREALKAATEDQGTTQTEYASWAPDALADHIEQRHHTYVREQIPVLISFLEKLCRVHGERHPELHEVRALFEGAAVDLTAHMQKEEQILFPYVRMLSDARSQKAPRFSQPPFGTAANPIRVMMDEHDHEGERFREIARLTDNYQDPADGCTTYRVAYQMLRDFESDLHLHIHLENNILFPAAIELENELINA